ncbi:unnamed protein product [Ixodes hexagonus]
MPEEELQDVLTVLKRVVTKDVIAEIERRTRAQAAEPEWMLYRRGMATASICHSFRTWAASIKRPATHPRPHNVGGLLDQVLRLNTFQSASMKRGQETKGVAKVKYLKVITEDGHCARIDNMGFMIWEEMPLLGCSPDGIVMYKCQCCLGRRTLLEVKCPNVVRNSFRKNGEDPISSYYTQTQIGMGVTGTDSCDYFVYQSEKVWKLVNIKFNRKCFHEYVEAVRFIYLEYLFRALRGV